MSITSAIASLADIPAPIYLAVLAAGIYGLIPFAALAAKKAKRRAARASEARPNE